MKRKEKKGKEKTRKKKGKETACRRCNLYLGADASSTYEEVDRGDANRLFQPLVPAINKWPLTSTHARCSGLQAKSFHTLRTFHHNCSMSNTI